MEIEKPLVITQKKAVDSDEFWGNKKRIVEIIGEGSGDGFKLKNANLPTDWQESLDNVKEIGIDRYASSISSVCNLQGYDLKEITFDTNKILTKLIIANSNNNEVSLELGGNFREVERAEYTTKNLSKIGSAVLMQAIISNYLSTGWGDKTFQYGYIGHTSDCIGSYYPSELAIPRSINVDEIVTSENYQESFKYDANNIAGRFGRDIKNIEFTKNGLLRFAEVNGVNGCYYSLENVSAGKNGRRYHCHNVDDARQAAALHGIVASYINSLLDKQSYNP